MKGQVRAAEGRLAGAWLRCFGWYKLDSSRQVITAGVPSALLREHLRR